MTDVYPTLYRTHYGVGDLIVVFYTGQPSQRWTFGAPVQKWSTGSGSPVLRWTFGAPLLRWTTGAPVQVT